MPAAAKARSRRRVRKPAHKSPSTPLVRTSERTSFKTCRWQWARGWIDQIKPRDEAPALRFGTLVHKALELRYPPGLKRGPKPAETFEQLYAASLKDAESKWGMQVEGEWEEAAALGVDLMEMFVEEYGRDEEWKVIQSEMTFKVPVLSKVDEKPLFYYVGTMDGVWQNRMDGGVRIQDWKTTSGDPIREGANKGVLDEQATAYWTWGVDYLIDKKILKPKEEQALDGMLYTFLRKARRDTRPKDADGHYLNQDGSVSKRQPPPYFHRELVYRSDAERGNARRRAVQEFIEMQAGRRGDLALYKTPATGATGHCRWCPFFDICELDEMGADWQSMRDQTMEKWEPYDAHEIEEEGKAR
jgi:hypothetical protein